MFLRKVFRLVMLLIFVLSCLTFFPKSVICLCPPTYNFKLDYIKSVRYDNFIFEDNFTNTNTFSYYTPLVGSLSYSYLDIANGVLNLNSSDSIAVPWGTDFDCKTQQEFSVPSLINGPWNGNYKLIARFKGETIEDLIPQKIDNIETSYDVVIARNNPFTAANGNVCSRGIEFTKVFHDPLDDRDKVQTISVIEWEDIDLNPDDPTLTIRIDLSTNGNVVGFYSTDRENTWYSLGQITGFPDSNFQGRIITSAYGNED
ncbi:MAG TPA: hypothetical protein PK581_09295 [Caldisericia bacterium]|nr:hypothetical protein [Caldisericia bacterium]